MDKINFKNLPNKTTSITAEKLNKIQENVEKAINEKSSLPVGGDEGQILAKASNQDNDVEWIDNIGQGGGDTLPIGAILPFSGDVIPNGWLLCDGSVIEQEDYPELFEVLAGNYGIISREEIRLPDLRGKVTVGKDSTDADFDTLGNTGGEKTHTLTVNEMPKHSHNFKFDQTAGSDVTAVKTGVNNSYGKATSETGGDQPHNNLQPYIVTNYIIKAKMTIVTVGEVIQETDTATTENVYSATAINNKISTNIITNQEVATNEYVDGKRVYIKKVEFTIPTTVNAWVTLIQLDNTVDDLIDKKLRYISNGQNYDIPYNFENEEITVYFDQNNNSLNIKTNFAYPGGKSGWGILKYTKQESST